MSPDRSDLRQLLAQTTDRAVTYLEGLESRRVGTPTDVAGLRRALDGPLPDGPTDPATVVRALADAAEQGRVASAGPRYFGFVVGGALPAALAADWLTTAWDQDGGLVALSPAAAVVEEVAGRWLVEILGLPPHCSTGFVTGGQMANFTALAAARHHVLAAAGWDVEVDGLLGAPPVRVVVGERRHATIDTSLRMLGLGTSHSVVVPCDDRGRMTVDGLAAALTDDGRPTIICAQAGEVNGGGFDPFPEICDRAHAVDAWVHVDGAFGLWAGASPHHRHLVDGVERADSWSTDGHKWLNVPYDSGFAFTAHPASHRSAFEMHASYLARDEDGPREPDDFVPEMSRRARGFATYAALVSLGRTGVADLVDRCCAHARRFADHLGAADGVEILNDVALNQVLVRFGDADEHTRRVVTGVQDEGTCWLGGTTWRGQAAMRISVSNWSTTTADVDRSIEAILRVHANV